MLASADSVAVTVGALVSLVYHDSSEAILWTIALMPAWLALAKLQGLYDEDQRSLRHLTIDEISKLVTWSIEITGVFAALTALCLTSSISLEDAVVFAATVAAGGFVLRVLARFLWRRVTPRERTVLVGRGSSVAAIRRKLELFDDIHVEIVDERATLDSEDVAADASWLESVDRVIVSSHELEEERLGRLIALCRDRSVHLSLVPPLRVAFASAMRLNRVADLPIIEYHTWDTSRSTLYLKRFLDLAICLLALPIVIPLGILIAATIKLDSLGPVFFAQERAGFKGRPFRMLKFRTMVCDAEAQLANLVRLDQLAEPSFKLVNDPRVTRAGRFLRRWSLDELPQLLNVLRGEMSMVGPRPEQMEVVAHYRPDHLFRLGVKPGLTGPMQVFGRGSLSFSERLAVEREYVDDLSLRRDLRLLAMTVSAVVRGRGAS